MELDPEIGAMNEVLVSFKQLDNGQRKRIVDWLTARFKLNEPYDSTQIALSEPVELKRTRRKPGPKKKTDVSASPEEKNIKLYDTVLELFSEADVKRVSSKILLMAAYLQEKLNIKEISSFDINSRLKRIRHGVTNISSAINGLLDHSPKLIDVIEQPGMEKAARRKFKVTEEGIKLANSYLRK